MQARLTCFSELRVANLFINVGGKQVLCDVSSFGSWGSISQEQNIVALDRRNVLLHF